MTEFFNEENKPLERSAIVHRRKRKALRRVKSAIIIMFVALLVTFAASFTFSWIKASTQATQVEDYLGPGGEKVLVSVPEGSTGADIAALLVKADVIQSEQPFIDAFNENPRANSIQPGVYYLKSKIPAKEAVAALLDPASKAEYTITIPEGMTTSQIYEKYANVYKMTTDEVKKQAEEAKKDFLPPEAGGIIEGWLAPGQYNFMPTTTVKDALQAMVDQRIKELEKSGVSKDMWQRQLIIASITEKEVSRAQDYPKVSRVIENRLAKDMLLQLDSTVLYGLGKSEIVLSGSDLETDTPYNTYIHKGLPPSPICNPGIDVLKATANPPEGDWLFWVTVNLTTGETKFSSTHEEHEKYAEEFRMWYEEHSSELNNAQ